MKKWIDTGAQYSRHWAFEPVTKPEPREVMDPSWPRNEIDHFILARLEREGMQPSRGSRSGHIGAEIVTGF